jgi:hypothetical protein
MIGYRSDWTIDNKMTDYFGVIGMPKGGIADSPVIRIASVGANAKTVAAVTVTKVK